MLFYCYKSNLRQVIGVPMGSDPVPFIGNLFLYYLLEISFFITLKSWFLNLKNLNLQKAVSSGSTCDDLSAINDNGLF